jgi:protein-S-isoprenylcysteine O-methyltransferase Ste14
MRVAGWAGWVPWNSRNIMDTHANDPAWKACKGVLIFVVALWFLIFLPAGSLSYWQGWLLWVHFTAWTAGATWYFLKHDTALVQRRLRAGPTAERDTAQKRIQLVVAIAVSALFLVSALDYRLGWSAVPWPAVVASNLLFAMGYLFICRVLCENSFASSTIEVAPNQKVISTGPYARMRHPMYAGALVMFLAIPPALGSWWGLAPFTVVIAGVLQRLKNEEAYLARSLPGYDVYRTRVRSRLIPGLW